MIKVLDSARDGGSIIQYNEATDDKPIVPETKGEKNLNNPTKNMDKGFQCSSASIEWGKTRE